MKKLCLFIFSLLLIFAAGCQLDTSEIDRETELEYITVDTSEGKTLYHIGEPFDKSGFRIIGHYSNGKEKKEDINLVNFPDVDTKEVNPELYVTVTYEDKPYSFPITVREVTPNGIRIKNNPKKMFYHTGDELNLDGIVVVVVNSDGSEGTPLNVDELSCSQVIRTVNTTPNTIMETVSIEYIEGMSTNLSVYVLPNGVNLTNIGLIEGERNKIPNNYRKGDDFNFFKVYLNCSYSNTVSQSLSLTDFNINPYSIKDLDESSQTVTISVITDSDEEKNDSFNIQIIDGYVVGAELVTDKNYYYDGDEIKFLEDRNQESNLVYRFNEIISKDNEVKDRSFTSDLFENLKYIYNPSNNKEFDTLTDSEKAALFASATSIRTKLDIRGVGLQKIYFYYKYTNDFRKRNESDSLIYYWAKNISVSDSPLQSITASFTGNNVPLEVKPNLDFEISHGGRWTINGNLKNGNSQIINAENCTFSFDSKFKNENPNDRKINVTYYDVAQNKTFTKDVIIHYINPIITGVKLDSFPSKRSYFVGDDLNLDGLKATLYYSDGTSKTVSDGYFTTEDENAVKYCSLTNNTITEETEEVNLFFTDVNDITNANAIYVTIPIEILGVKIDYIEISPKDNYKSNLKFRKGEQYDFLNFFEVKSVSNKGDSTPIQNAEDLTFNLVSNFNTATLYVVYTTGGKSYSASYSEEITVLEPQPLSITYNPPTDYGSFDDYVNNARYTVHYKDGTIVPNKTIGELGIAGFQTTSSFPNLSLTITHTIETDCTGATFSAFTQTLDLSQILKGVTGISITPKQTSINYIRGTSVPECDDFNIYAQYGNNKSWKIQDCQLDFDFLTNTTFYNSCTKPVKATYYGFTSTCEVTVQPDIKEVKVYVGEEEIKNNKYKFPKETTSVNENSFSYKIKAAEYNSQPKTQDKLSAYDINSLVIYYNSNSKKLTISKVGENSPFIEIDITIETN